jgi:hypothetical protein
VRLGSYEFKKKGVSRFDLRDPYHLAVALTWPQFLAALLALYLSVNVVFATLFWLGPGSVANARPTLCCVALTRIAIRAIKSRANFVRNSSKMC